MARGAAAETMEPFATLGGERFMVSIVLLQHNPLVGECLRRAIVKEPGMHVAGMANTLAQARQCIDRGGADVLVADLRVGDERLIDLLAEWRRREPSERPRVMVIALAMALDDRRLMQALRHGAHGYFIHGNPIHAVADAIRQVLAGESPMSPPIARWLKAHFRQPGRADGRALDGARPAPGLTESEHRMLNRASEGYLACEIAREMRTSEHRIGLSTRSLYRKLQSDISAVELSTHPA